MSKENSHTLAIFGMGFAFAFFVFAGFGWTFHARKNPETTAAIACQAGYSVRSTFDTELACRELVDNYAP